MGIQEENRAEKDHSAEANSSEKSEKIPKAKFFEPEPLKYLVEYDSESKEFLFAKKLPRKKKPRISGSRWYAMFQDADMWLAKQDLTSTDFKVFHALKSKLDYDNYIRISQTKLSEEMGMKIQQTSRSIKNLTELNIITEGPKDGPFKSYMLNPNIGIKGKHKKEKQTEYKETSKKYRQTRQERAKEKNSKASA